MAGIGLEEFLAFVAAAVVAVPIARRLGFGAVLGYLIAGVAMGPWGLSVVARVEEVTHLAELGVVFLMFLIGIELKPGRLWLMRRDVFGMGGAQVALTGAVFAILAAALGQGGEAAILIGAGLALSSTAMVLKILSERGAMTTRVGRTSFAILLFQDIAIVPLLAFVSVVGGGGSLWAELGGMALRTVAILLVVAFGGWLVLRPVLRSVAAARTPEVFAAAAVLVVLGVAWLVSKAGLPMELGAFVAGLLLSESEFRHQIEADLQPFRGFLLGLFFMTVGMTIDFGLVASQGAAIAALVAAICIVKFACLFPVVHAFGHSRVEAARVALLLTQGGEFAFVLFGLAAAAGAIEPALRDLLVLAVALTMALTPGFAILGDRVGGRAARSGRDLPGRDESAPDVRPVLIAGFGRIGKTIAAMLAAKGVAYVALDRDPERVADGRRDGYAVYFGDAGHPDVLRAAGAARARLVVITLDEPHAAESALWAATDICPEARVIARARDVAHAGALRAAGADHVVLETLEASLQLGARVLNDVGVDRDEVASLVNAYRDADYGRMAGLGLGPGGETPPYQS
ncbi:MAG: monovalent cation:proton antiporter-2 (CPA2) family protein [Rhodospirillaceae bacterium]